VIAPQDAAGRRFFVVVVLEEVGRQHRCHETRRQQREEHLHRHRDAELLEELSGDPGHEARRREDRDDGQRDRDHREADLVGGFEGRTVRRSCPCMWRTMFSISTMASSTRMPVDSVMARNADQIEREAEQVHRPECREDRQRQRDRRDDGGPEVAQEQQHDHDGEDGALEQGRDRGLVVALGVLDRRVDQLQVDVGIGRLERVDPLLHRRRDDDVAGALGALDAERHHRLAVEAGEGAAVGDGVGDGAEIVEPHSRRLPNSGIMVPASSLSVLAPASVRIAWSFLPISARPPATSTLVPRRLWLTLTAVSPIAWSGRDRARPGSRARHRRCARPGRRRARPACARLTTSSTK
jgi:hypothetical protein